MLQQFNNLNHFFNAKRRLYSASSASSWSSVTSLWNRIRSGTANKSTSEELKDVKLNTPTPTPTPTIATPWTISNTTKTREPLREFWVRSGLFRVSAQKLNMLGRQITSLTLPSAILQMRFSQKRAAKEVHSVLLQAQARIKMEGKIISTSADKDKDKKLTAVVDDPNKFVVQQAVIGKGSYLKRIDIKGRGRHGVIWRPHAFIRIQVAIPDPNVILHKQFKIRINREDKPVMVRLDY